MQDFGLVVGDSRTGRITLSLSGEIDAYVAPRVLNSVLCAAFSFENSVIEVDLSEVTFMDSAGLRALEEARLRVSNDGSRMVVTNASDLVERLVRLTDTEMAAVFV